MSQQRGPVHASIEYNLLSFIAHESRGPFNGLIGFSELLSNNNQQLTPEQQTSYAELVYQLAVKSFLQLQTFIVWTKLISNNLVIQVGVTNFSEWIHQVISFLKVDLQSKQIELKSDSSNRVIKGDQQLLSVALANLIYASFRYSSEQSTIYIRTQDESISICLPYSGDFEQLLEETLSNPQSQSEQNYRLWIAFQIFERSGLRISAKQSKDRSNLEISLLPI